MQQKLLSSPGSTAVLPAQDGNLLAGIAAHLPGVVLVSEVSGALVWANSRATLWFANAWLGAVPSLPGVAVDALGLPWHVERSQLRRIADGDNLVLRVESITGADGIQRRCSARLAPLPRPGAASLVLWLIEAEFDVATAGLSDSQQRRALASAQVGSWSRDFATGTARVDPLWCHALGLDPCEGDDHLQRWMRRVHPDDAARLQRAGDELACAGREAADFDVEYRLLTDDSRWLWVLQRGRVCRRAADGTPLLAAGICLDIDARKRAEVEIHESESQLATALWGAQAAFWRYHVPSDSAVRSPLWYAMTGYSREQWDSVPKPWTSRLHPDDRASIDTLIAEHLGGQTQSIEVRYRMRCADGSWKWIMDRGRVVEWDFDGRPIHAIGVSLDIDAQKRAELELRSSEARLETAIWGAGVGLYELDCATGATRWLNDWCERFDIEPCGGVDHVDRWDANIHPDDLPAARARFTGHLEGREEYYDAEYRLRTRSGAWRWLFERGRVSDRDAEGRPLRLVGTCMDIDARKRVEVGAEDTHRRLELALESAQGVLWEWDVAREQYNDAYYELHGVPAAEGRKDPEFWSHRVHADDRERVLEAERELIAGRIDSFNARYRVRHADGSWRWMVDRFRAAARDEHGRATRLIGVATDITDDVEMRAALRAAEAAARGTQEQP
jgi:PAS domain S-box-containing protein